MNKYGRSMEKITRAWSPRARGQDGQNRISNVIAGRSGINSGADKVFKMITRDEEPEKFVGGPFRVPAKVKQAVEGVQDQDAFRELKEMYDGKILERKREGDLDITATKETMSFKIVRPENFEKWADDITVNFVKKGA